MLTTRQNTINVHSQDNKQLCKRLKRDLNRIQLLACVVIYIKFQFQWPNANTQLAQHGGQRQRTITPPPTSVIYICIYIFFFVTILSQDKS